MPGHKVYEKVRTDPNFNSAIINPMSKALYQNKALPIDSRYLVCRKIFKMLPVVIYFKKHFFLIDAMNEKIETIKAAGLVEFWHFQSTDRKFFKLQIIARAESLTFDQLVESFQVLVFGCSVGLIV